MEPTKTGIDPICQLCWYVRRWMPPYKQGVRRRVKYFCGSKKSDSCNKEVSFQMPCEHYAYNPFNQFERHSLDGRLRTDEELKRMLDRR